MKYRPTAPADREQLAEWISQDEDHKDKNNPEFWLPQDRTNCFAGEDDSGPVFYVRGESVLRLHLQFAPKSEWRRLARTIDQFAEQIRKDASKNYRQIIFESTSPGLIKFLSKRGYRNSPNEYVIDL
jgi:hypothetical protein